MMALKNSAAISSLFYERQKTAIPAKNAARLNEMEAAKALAVFPNLGAAILAGKTVVTIAVAFSQPRHPMPAPSQNKNPVPQEATL